MLNQINTAATSYVPGLQRRTSLNKMSGIKHQTLGNHVQYILSTDVPTSTWFKSTVEELALYFKINGSYIPTRQTSDVPNEK